jgi:soluble lytic murein transglycosylase-like protein
LSIPRQLGFLLAIALFSLGAFPADAPAPRVSSSSHTEYDAVLQNGFSIHHLRRETLGETTRLFISNEAASYIDVATAQIQSIEEVQISDKVNPAATVSISDAVNAASDKHQIDADLINSVIRAESAFNPRAVSRKGAQGLMQLMPGTADKLGVKDAFDPAANVNAGTQYLRDLLVLYNGDMVKALAAYNAGPRRVAQYQGVPPYHETRAYVAQIVRDFNRKKLAAQKAQAATQSRTKHRVPPTSSATASQ